MLLEMNTLSSFDDAELPLLGKKYLFSWGKLWHDMSVETEQSLSLNHYKTRIKNWKTEECACHLCRRYVAQEHKKCETWISMSSEVISFKNLII